MELDSNLCARTYKYDDSLLEFFVETSDTVKIRKADLDSLTRSDELDVKEPWLPKFPKKPAIDMENVCSKGAAVKLQ